MKKISTMILLLVAVLASCKKTPEVNLKYVDVERDLITVGTTTATIQCDYEYIATLKKAYLYYGEGEDATDMNTAEMRVVQKTLYVELTGLKENTTYSYCYEFVNGFNSMKSAVKAFKTEASPTTVTLPTVVTAEVTEITTNSAKCGGEVTNNGGAEVTERGICWGTNANPTLNDSHIASGSGTGAFTAMMNSLEANTTYHVRAYATNEKGTAYGLDKTCATLSGSGGGNSDVPTGAIGGLFTLCDGQQVYFSQGNLQYQASTNTWRFAENQWDFVGTQAPNQGESGGTVTGSDNSLISSTYNGWIDLFGWGTSGWNNGNLYYQPYDTETTNNHDDGGGYGPTNGMNYNYGLTGTYSNADWGVYNAISNGGNEPNQWRTLDNIEWRCIFEDRNTPSGIRYAKATVNDVDGVILLPDNWNAAVYELNYPNDSEAPYSANILSGVDWGNIESNGAVFLPSAGSRAITNVAVGVGCYWSASWHVSPLADGPIFSNSYLFPLAAGDRFFGRSVRLVQNAISHPSNTTPSVITFDVSNVTSNSAFCGGEVTNDGVATVTERGICWGTNANPTISDNHVDAGTGTGLFSATMSDLQANTTYHVRAYATNEAGTAYGLDKEFTTLSGGGGNGAHDYVDLGLPSGTLWATCNVGANSPEEYGDYFAWAEIETKTVYDWSTYKYCNGNSNALTKYCYDSFFGNNGFVDTLTVLQPSDDAVIVNWGDDWRIPTAEQWIELKNNTSRAWVSQNGVNGCLFSASNGNSVFLPAAGSRKDNEFINVGIYGNYWTATLEVIDTDDPRDASVSHFASNYHVVYGSIRSLGSPIRPVRR